MHWAAPLRLRHVGLRDVGRVVPHEPRRRRGAVRPRDDVLLARRGKLRRSHHPDPHGRLHRPSRGRGSPPTWPWPNSASSPMAGLCSPSGLWPRADTAWARRSRLGARRPETPGGFGLRALQSGRGACSPEGEPRRRTAFKPLFEPQITATMQSRADMHIGGGGHCMGICSIPRRSAHAPLQREARLWPGQIARSHSSAGERTRGRVLRRHLDHADRHAPGSRA